MKLSPGTVWANLQGCGDLKKPCYILADKREMEQGRHRTEEFCKQDSNLSTQSGLDCYKNLVTSANPTSGLPTPSNKVSHLLLLTLLPLRVLYCSETLFILLHAKRKWFMLLLKPWKILPQKHD